MIPLPAPVSALLSSQLLRPLLMTAHGSFAFQKKATAGEVTTPDSFACPADNPLVYVVARGGNPLNNHDSR